MSSAFLACDPNSSKAAVSVSMLNASSPAFPNHECVSHRQVWWVLPHTSALGGLSEEQSHVTHVFMLYSITNKPVNYSV